MREYNEIFRLRKMLVYAGIPHVMHRLYDGWQIEYQHGGEGRKLSAVQHYFSYGHEHDRIEIMGLLTEEEEKNDSVLGYLTAENVFERIEREEQKNEKAK